MAEVLLELATPANIIIALFGLIVAIVVGYHNVVPARDRVRREFLTHQPNVRIASAPAMSAGQSYTVGIRLHNLGRTAAHEAIVTMDGWPSEARAQILHPFRPGHNEYEVPLELGRDSPVRTELIQGAQVRIRYRDRWHHLSEVTYPVVQTRRDDGLFGVRIQTGHRTVVRPRLSVRKMRNFLRETPNFDR